MVSGENREENAGLEEISRYWKGKNIPQQWYSNKERYTVQWFNDISYKRYNLYYEYLKEEAEFQYHRDEDVLEVGCGLGTDLIEYAKNGARVSGIDLGEEQVMLAKLNFQSRNLPYQTIKAGNAEEISFDNGSFDLVFSFGVLHHTVDAQKAIDEIYRVLRSDGHAIVMLYARGWKHYLKRCFVHGIILGKWIKCGFNWQKVYNKMSEIHGNSPRTAVYTKRQIQNMFKGFGDVVIKKKRLGEFFDYPPYRTCMFPRFIKKLLYFFGLESLIGENWLIKAYKASPPKRESLWNVVFKHY